MLGLIVESVGPRVMIAVVLVWRHDPVAKTLFSHWLGMARRRVAAVAGLMLLAALPALAAEPVIVTVHQAKLLRLQRAAEVVMIANPTIANVVVESPQLIFVLGLEPGETSLHILDGRGNEILRSAVVVVPTAERTVTVYRANNLEEATYSCAPRCATVGTAVGEGAAPPTGSGASDTTATAEATDTTATTSETTTDDSLGSLPSLPGG